MPDAGDGKDFIYISPTTNVPVEVHGGPGNDKLYLLGKSASKGYGDDGNDIIYGGTAADKLCGGAGIDKLYGGAGDDTIRGGDGDDYIEGDGTKKQKDASGNQITTQVSGKDIIYGDAGADVILAGDGDDTIYVSGDDQIHGGAGADSISVGLTNEPQNPQIFGDADTDTVTVTLASGGNAILLGNHIFSNNGSSVTFDNTTDTILLADSATTTRLTTASASSMDFGSVDFKVTGSAIDVSAATLRAPTGAVRLAGQSLTGTINSELGRLSVSTTSGSSAGNLVVRELNDLELIDQGLQTNTGLVDVRLAEAQSTLALSGGQIRAGGAGKSISIIADDIDFKAGEKTVAGTGTLTIASLTNTRNYNVGSAGETAAGGDLSTGTDNGAMNLSMVDLAAIGDVFTSVTIGHRNAGNVMLLGDAQDQTTVKYTTAARAVNAALRIPPHSSLIESTWPELWNHRQTP
ncbi:MAG UNVERIFIED_CONTAM: hypothetical protein LVR18_46805 [Planctomycetaceae bacterium]